MIALRPYAGPAVWRELDAADRECLAPYSADHLVDLCTDAPRA